jgi:hypothetical protein
MILDERALTLTQATKILPGRPHVSTVWRWCRRGVNGICLEHRRLGGKIITSHEAIERFAAALAEHDESNAVARTKRARKRSDAERAADINRAVDECRRARI